jgi:hypothetical protein
MHKKEFIDNTDINKAEYYNILTTENSFEVEDPDPAKRTWYYDAWGIKRKKSTRSDHE